MQDLLKKALKKCDRVEIYNSDSVNTQIEFSNARLHNIESSYQSGHTLRIIKDDLLGFSYTKNLLDPEGLIDNAVSSLDGNVKVGYKFPHTINHMDLNTYNPRIHDLKTELVVDECSRISEILSRKTKAEIEMSASFSHESIQLANSSGTSLNQNFSGFYIWMNLCYPGGAAGLSANCLDLNFITFPDHKIEALAELYNISEKPVEPAGAKMQVLFMPTSLYTLIWRLRSATSGESIFKKISPLAEKVGEEIFSPVLTIFDNPHDDSIPGARAFDDEGVATSYMNIIENGVLKNFYYDLNYASKMKTESTGHGYKSAMWGGDTAKLKPAPNLSHLSIKPGSSSLQEMISSIDKGIILNGVMGAHSGNIPNGDYSVGVSPALYVEKGKILGRVKDAMVAGNIYETLKNINSIENKTHNAWGGLFPAILCDEVSVSTK
jgi:PmbA protein